MPANPSLGLCFTDEFIEISQFSTDGTRVESFNQMALPQGVVINSDIKNSTVFAQALRQLLSTAKPSAIPFDQELVVGVNDSRVFLRVFTVPNMAGKNINDIIEYQIRTLIQVLPSDMETDWQIIGKDDDGQIEVLLVAIPRDLINSYVSACSLAGLRVIAIEPTVFASIRTINQAQFQGKNQLLVYLGDNFGIFSYLTGGNPRFSEFVTKTEIDQGGSLLKTVQTYINFANSKNVNRPVQEVLVTGSKLDLDEDVKNIELDGVFAVKAVSRTLGTSSEKLSPLRISAGLSLKTLIGQSTVNILPVDLRLEVVRQRMTSSWKSILDMLILFSLIVLIGLFYIYRNATERRNEIGKIKSGYEQQLSLPESQALIKQAESLNKVTSRLVNLREIVGGEEVVLQELTQVTPPGITITSMMMTRMPGSKRLKDGSDWIITGIARSRPVVLNFYKELIKFPEYQDGTLYFGSLEKNSELTFRIANTNPNEN